MKNVPTLRFKDFSSEWQAKKLGEVTKTITSGSRDWAQYYADAGSKFIRMTNLSRDGIHLKLDDLKFVDVNSLSADGKRTSLVSGDVLISITAELGKIGWIPPNFGEAFINQHTALVRIKAGLANSKLIAYLLSTPKINKKINKLNDAGAKAGLNLPTIKSIDFYFPALQEQTKIADFLTAIDDRISQLSQKCDGLAQYKKGVMQKIFSQELRFKDEKGRAFPAWEEKRLGDVFTEILDKIGDADIETYSISAGKGFVSQKEKFGRDISGMQNSKYIKLKPSEFAYNKGSSKAFVYGCVYPNTTGKEIGVPNVFICFRSMAAVATGFYAKLFERNYLDKHLKNIISSSARLDGLLNVNKVDFFNILLPYPCFKEQERIAGFLGAVDEKISQAQAQLDALKQYKQGLLQQMFV